MERREAIRRLGLLMGGTLSASAVTGLLGGCRVDQSSTTYTPATLTTDQDELVATVADLIVPATDTPGAREARVNEFIDKMLTDWFVPDERDHFLAGLATVDEHARESYQRAFLQLRPAEQTAILTQMEELAVAESTSTDTTRPPFFQMMKGLTILGYYTSEIGATQELLDMPFGTYDGSVPYEKIGRSWS